MFSFFFGRTPEFNFEGRFLNAATLLGAIFCFQLGIIKTVLHPSALASGIFFSSCIILLAFFYFARVRRASRRLAWPVAIFFLLLLSSIWIFGGGLEGGSQFYFILMGVLSIFILPGNGKILFGAMALCVSASLLFAEREGLWMQDLAGSEKNFPYLAFSFLAAQIFLYIMIILVSRNYGEIIKKLESYRAIFEEDLTLARILQKQILEYSPEVTADFDFELMHLPSADLSGDVYDISRPAPEHLRIFLADARGHGINASLSAMLIKSEWLNVNSPALSPARILNRLNNRIINRYGDTVSLSALIVDIHRDHLLYSAGGHFPQFLLQGETVLELDSKGPPPGIFLDTKYEEIQKPLDHNSRLVLFTDGLVEGEKNEGLEAGLAWLSKTLAETAGCSAAETSKHIINALARQRRQDVKHLKLCDDLTLMVLGQMKNDPA